MSLKFDNAVFLNKKIDKDFIDETLLFLTTIDSNKNVYVVIDSKGGYHFPGHIFIREMKQMQSKNIIFVCIGKNVSHILFDIFQFCDLRYVIENTTMMIEYPKFNKHINRFDDDFDFSIYEELKCKIFKHANITEREYYNLIREKTWILKGYKEILKHNFADDVINYLE